MSNVIVVNFGQQLDDMDGPSEADLAAIEAELGDWDIEDEVDRYFDDEDDRFPFDDYEDEYDYDEDY